MNEMLSPEGQRPSSRGCLVASLVMLALVVGGVIYVFFQYDKMKWQRPKGVVKRLAEAASTEEQKKEAKELLDKLIQGARDDKIMVKVGDTEYRGIKALIQLLETKRGLYMYGVAYQVIRIEAIDRSTLSDEEKQQARQIFIDASLAAREGLLTDEEMKEWEKSCFPSENPLGTKEKKLTDEEVRKIIAGLKAIVDAKELPADEAFHYDYELDKLLNEARKALGLKEKVLTPPPAPATAPTTAPTTAPATAPAG